MEKKVSVLDNEHLNSLDHGVSCICITLLLLNFCICILKYLV